MKKLTLLIAVMLLSISTVSLSQIKYGVKAGLTSANQDWSAGGISINPDARIGAALGVFVKSDIQYPTMIIKHITVSCRKLKICYFCSHGTIITTNISKRYQNDNHDTWC